MKNENITQLNQLPKATHIGILKILNKELSCAVLKNGTRLINMAAVFNAFELTRRGVKKEDKGVFNIPSFVGAKNFQPYITTDILGVFNITVYIDKNGRKVQGYSPEILTHLCDIYLKSRRDKTLHYSQVNLANLAEIMISSLAKVGITALIDEATGYQDVRPKDALQLILDKYIKKEFSEWTKKFPDQFYIQLFRLKGWNINKENFTKRPGIVGTITNDLVYKRLAPDILLELEKTNPKVGKHRNHNHHQLLTEDIGNKALSNHLFAITNLMRGYDSWAEFYSMINKIFPMKNLENFNMEHSMN